ncbi:MAG TPA: MiaB/RimO family radical SAM methylthiotransferase [Gemmatimonadaceae bacterium]|nr:MiaB/RimO family radical SAM methylthiotransferase [Gemmatimonadaceae bacterium]
MKLYLRTFGCRANQYDGEAVRALATAAGWEIVTEPVEADVAVFNGCTVTAAADRDLRHAVRRAASSERALRTVIMGCSGARTAAPGSAGSLHDLPGVVGVVPGADMPAIAAMLGLPRDVLAAAPTQQAGTRALLRIQDGCDEHCTFCASTLARGAHRSRDASALIDEASRLAERHPEIVLTGVHIGHWGREHDTSLAALVERLVAAVPIVRFRLTSIEATEVDERLADLICGEPERVAPHLHAPLQSGSDGLLRRMGRHWYTAATYACAVERLARRATVLGLGADIITGFPAESESDHLATLALVERLPFTYLHVFPYSPRPGTAATRLGRSVPAGVARRRAAELRALAGRKAEAYRATRAGGEADVVVIGDGAARNGLTGDYLSVALANPATARGERFLARLEGLATGLVAHRLHSTEH